MMGNLTTTFGMLHRLRIWKPLWQEPGCLSSTHYTLMIWLLPGEHWSLVYVERSKKLSPKYGHGYRNTAHDSPARSQGTQAGKSSTASPWAFFMWAATRGRCPLLGRVFPLQAILPGDTLTHPQTWLLVGHRSNPVGNKYEPPQYVKLHLIFILFLKLKYN